MIYKVATNPFEANGQKNQVKLFFAQEKKPTDKNNNHNSSLDLSYEWKCLNDLMVQTGHAVRLKKAKSDDDNKEESSRMMSSLNLGRHQSSVYLNDQEELDILAEATLKLNRTQDASFDDELTDLEQLKAYLRYGNKHERFVDLEDLARIPGEENMEFIDLTSVMPIVDATRPRRPQDHYEDNFKYDLDDSNIFINGSRTFPFKSIAQAPLNKAIKDYLSIKGIISLTEADSYHWANLLRSKLVSLKNLI